MHIIGERTLGIAILILLAVLVLVKKAASGSILRERPRGEPLLWVVNLFNLFFLLIVNPLAAMLLIADRLQLVDPTHVAIGRPLVLDMLEIAGAVLYVGGCLLMTWALVSLGRSYQVAGNAPRSDDAMIMNGPYRLARHPMYAAALCISLGLAWLTQSLAGFIIFCVYLALIGLVIPIEEEGLRRAYGERYVAYTRAVKRLIPFIV